MKVLLNGSGGKVLWGYAVAAECDKFEVQQSGKKITLEARLGASDVFRLRQSSLIFEVRAGACRWTWPITTLAVTNGRLTATLQPMVKG